MKIILRRAIWIAIALAIIVALVFAFRPQPVEVELAAVQRGPMMVTVDEEGKTRIREKYVIAAPLEGRLRRIELDPGDPITANKTLIAVIDPIPPSLLDVRTQAAAEARVRAAEAELQRTESMYQKANDLADLAKSDFNRVVKASESNAATTQELDEATTKLRVAQQDLKSAGSARDVARYELELAQSALLTTKRDGDETSGGGNGGGAFEVLAPITGKVLRVLQESAAPVRAGEPLVEVGDPTDLEIVVDVLSSAAAKTEPGMHAILEQWGGGPPLDGIVRTVEPAGFTKISALGVEEQRVNVILDLTTPIDQRKTLGDEFRVEARIVLWQADDVLKAPGGALFRHADGWAVFVDDDGRARIKTIAIGHQNALETEVLDGLVVGEQVILHPGDRVEDGTRVTRRK